jgi:hypothetical protein
MTRDYDGFYFLPGDNDGELKLEYFKFQEQEYIGEPIGASSLGDMYHIAFFKWIDGGDLIFDEQFEAIFADPTTYIKNILGADLYGCVLRKTDVSSKWWDIYLKKIKDASIITSNKMKEKQNYE